MPTEKEIERIEKAELFDLFLLIDSAEKEEYTKDELKELIMQIARQKEK